jgi:multisubunit Na+/H+ antiporter MnhB subunit
MSNMNRGNIWAACSIFGVVIAFVLSYFTSPGLGFPVGALLGVGTAFVLTSFSKTPPRDR